MKVSERIQDDLSNSVGHSNPNSRFWNCVETILFTSGELIRISWNDVPLACKQVIRLLKLHAKGQLVSDTIFLILPALWSGSQSTFSNDDVFFDWWKRFRTFNFLTSYIFRQTTLSLHRFWTNQDRMQFSHCSLKYYLLHCMLIQHKPVQLRGCQNHYNYNVKT